MLPVRPEQTQWLLSQKSPFSLLIPQSPSSLSWRAILRAESEEGAAISRSCARVTPPPDCFVASLLDMTAAQGRRTPPNPHSLPSCHCEPFSEPGEEKARQSRHQSDRVTPHRDGFVAPLLAMTAAQGRRTPPTPHSLPSCHCEPFSESGEEKARQSLLHALASHHPEIASSLRSSQ